MIAVVVLGRGIAHAQPAPAPAPGPAPADPVPPPAPAEPEPPRVIEPPAGFDRDLAWSAYDGAFRDAAAGDLRTARARLAEIASRWPGHPADARAAALLGRRGPRRDDPNGPSN